MRWLGKITLVLVGGLIGLGAMVVAAWAIDDAVHAGEVTRNVVIGDIAVGGLGRGHLAAVISGIAAEQADFPVVIETPGQTYEFTASDLGITVDEPATAAAALVAGRAPGVPDRFTSWAESFSASRTVALEYVVDETRLAATINGQPDVIRSVPVNPSFDGASGRLDVVPPVDGAYVDSDVVAAAVSAALSQFGLPLSVEVPLSATEPEITDVDLQVALSQYDDLVAEPVFVEVDGAVKKIGADTVRRWITSDVQDGVLVPVVVPDRVHQSLEAIVGIEVDGTAPSFAVIGGAHVEIALGNTALTCCDIASVPAVIDAVQRDQSRFATVELRPLSPDGGLGAAEAMGIVEIVGDFTTFHGCCASRVDNIQNIADIVRGAVIEPGGTFSINEFVGRRTRAKGFVAAGVIQNGHFTDGVGGGISQFATTMFNAAFFAGMDLDEYQSHSIYISRYPYGREATMSYPHPDLVITNPTPYSVLIWTEYTPTSITVELWSTKYFAVSETGQSSSRVGACTRVTTFRERIAPDGTLLEDSVFAVYRPGEGLDCAGRATAQP